jgi:hypothetical protein
MLHIDRVHAQMEVLPGANTGAASPAGATPEPLDPNARRRLSEIVLEVLHEHVRALERQGAL